MSSKQWTFTVDKHTPSTSWARRGKPEWQDGVTIRVSHRRALELIGVLAGSLRYEEPGCDVHYINLPGELTEDTDDV